MSEGRLRTHVIFFENIDDTQRTLIHAAIKKHAAAWWHELKDGWVVNSNLKANDWSNILLPFVPHPPAAFMVMQLHEGAEWVAAGRAGQFGWIKENRVRRN